VRSSTSTVATRSAWRIHPSDGPYGVTTILIAPLDRSLKVASASG